MTGVSDDVAPRGPLLVNEYAFGGLTLRNRAWVAPMCQYSCRAHDGVPTAWHLVHLGSFATGGFGLILTEATAVVPEGRLSPEDTGLWNDSQLEAWRPIVDFVHAQGARVAIQLGHAGRKGSTWSPFSGRRGSISLEEGGWETVGPGGDAFGSLAPPRGLSLAEIRDLPGAFAASARRAETAGFDAVEVHAAHGYLLHQFLSPLINQRTDAYGGDFTGRVRLLREVVAAVRSVLPPAKPVLVRISATDWAEGGWDVEQSIELTRLLAKDGADLVDVSSGGAVEHQRIDPHPHYQVPFADAIGSATGVPVAAVGLIEDPGAAEQVLASGQADVVLLGRAALREPRWALRAAAELGMPATEAPYPPQYRAAAWRDRSPIDPAATQ